MSSTVNLGIQLGIKKHKLEGKYLVLPLNIPKSKQMAFQDIKQKVFNGLEGWKAKCLSQAGRCTPIKSVANTLPSYAMSTFLLPKSWCKEIDIQLKIFFWGFWKQKTRNFTSMAWDAICKPKDVGGLGIRRLYDMNRALIAKLGWLLSKNPNSLWSWIILAKYLKNHSFFDIPPSRESSWFWKGITATSDLVHAGACYLVKINIWTDPWVPNMPQHLAILNPSCQFYGFYFKVHQLIDWDTLCWKQDLVLCLFTLECAREILNILLSHTTERWFREIAPNGRFSVKSASFLDQTNRLYCRLGWEAKWWKKLRAGQMQARLKVFSVEICSECPSLERESCYGYVLFWYGIGCMSNLLPRGWDHWTCVPSLPTSTNYLERESLADQY